MAQPTKKFFGSFDLEELKAAIVAAQKNDELSEYNGKKQVKIGGAQWDDGNISIDIWNKAEKKAYKVGQLRVSTLDNAAPQQSINTTPQSDDLPF